MVTPIYSNKIAYNKKNKEVNHEYRNKTLSCNNNINNYILPTQIKPKKNHNKHSISSGLNLDHNTKKKIDKGRYQIDDVLDLHGYTLDTAYNVLINFIIKNYNLANRCLLIITGWNSTNQYDNNSIKSNFSKWLQSEKICEIILYYKQAINSYGGKGAFYVLLKSKNKKI
ncbi:Smr/MutS family protein [Ehrlichia sp. JZT12]